MTEHQEFNNYYQGPERLPIQVKYAPDLWLVWNWNTVSWDKRPAPVNPVGLGTEDKS